MLDSRIVVGMLMFNGTNDGTLVVIPLPGAHPHPFTGKRVAAIGTNDQSGLNSLFR